MALFLIQVLQLCSINHSSGNCFWFLLRRLFFFNEVTWSKEIILSFISVGKMYGTVFQFKDLKIDLEGLNSWFTFCIWMPSNNSLNSFILGYVQEKNSKKMFCILIFHLFIRVSMKEYYTFKIYLKYILIFEVITIIFLSFFYLPFPHSNSSYESSHSLPNSWLLL